MQSRLTLLSISIALIATCAAIPHDLLTRDDGVKTYSVNNKGFGWFTYFAPTWPTCGNDAYITNLLSTAEKSAAKQSVYVQPDCDNVIDMICRASSIEAGRYTDTQPMRPIGYVDYTCEGHIMFPNTREFVEGFSYQACQSGFQGITEMCMLINDPNNKHNYASQGVQFGVMNVLSTNGLTTDGDEWVLNPKNQVMGFMMGAPHTFGTKVNAAVGEVMADTIVAQVA